MTFIDILTNGSWGAGTKGTQTSAAVAILLLGINAKISGDGCEKAGGHLSVPQAAVWRKT